MGFNGDVVVLRSTEPLSTYTPYADTAIHLTSAVYDYAEGWRAVHVRHYKAPYTYEDAWIAELAQATGAPALVCNIFESDRARVRGSSRAGWWEGWLDPGSASVAIAADRYDAFMQENYRGPGSMEDVDLGRLVIDWETEELRRLERERPATVDAAAAWAAVAGYRVPVEPIAQVLARRRDPFVEDLFFDLLGALGIRKLDPQ